MASANQYTQRPTIDVTSTDPKHLAMLWELHTVELPGDLLALQVAGHCYVQSIRGKVPGVCGDVLIVNTRTGNRRIITGSLFEFLFEGVEL